MKHLNHCQSFDGKCSRSSFRSDSGRVEAGLKDSRKMVPELPFEKFRVRAGLSKTGRFVPVNGPRVLFVEKINWGGTTKTQQRPLVPDGIGGFFYLVRSRSGATPAWEQLAGSNSHGSNSRRDQPRRGLINSGFLNILNQGGFSNGEILHHHSDLLPQ